MGGFFGFTQDPYMIGDESGMAAQDVLSGRMSRFPFRSRFRRRPPADESGMDWLSTPMGQQDNQLAESRSTAAVAPTGGIESQPQFPARERFKQVLSEQPETGDYEPSLWRRIAAAVGAGAAEYGRQGSGMQVGETIREAPLRKADKRWQRQATAAQRAAQLEKEEFEMGQAAARGQRETKESEAEIKLREAQLKEAQSDKKIDEYVNKANQRVLVFQRADGTSYEKALQEVQEKDETLDQALMSKNPAVRQRAIDALRQKQRFTGKPGEGQGDTNRRVIAERNKNKALQTAEREYQRRIAAIGKDSLALPEDVQAQKDEAYQTLLGAKQAAEDAFVGELEAAGFSAEPFDYYKQDEERRAGSAGAGAGAGSKPAPTKHKVGDRVRLKGVGEVTITKIYPDGTFDYK